MARTSGIRIVASDARLVAGNHTGGLSRRQNRTCVLARPTGVRRAGTHSGFKLIPIEGAEEWGVAYRDSA